MNQCFKVCLAWAFGEFCQLINCINYFSSGHAKVDQGSNTWCIIDIVLLFQCFCCVLHCSLQWREWIWKVAVYCVRKGFYFVPTVYRYFLRMAWQYLLWSSSISKLDNCLILVARYQWAWPRTSKLKWPFNDCLKCCVSPSSVPKYSISSM